MCLFGKGRWEVRWEVRAQSKVLPQIVAEVLIYAISHTQEC